jgi:hypothetical protein
MATTEAEEQPMAVQLAGCEPAVMAEAARLNADRGAQIIDINFGCPVKKVVNGHAGSALMRDEAHAARILEATVKGSPETSPESRAHQLLYPLGYSPERATTTTGGADVADASGDAIRRPPVGSAAVPADGSGASPLGDRRNAPVRGSVSLSGRRSSWW